MCALGPNLQEFFRVREVANRFICGIHLSSACVKTQSVNRIAGMELCLKLRCWAESCSNINNAPARHAAAKAGRIIRGVTVGARLLQERTKVHSLSCSSVLLG